MLLSTNTCGRERGRQIDTPPRTQLLQLKSANNYITPDPYTIDASHASAPLQYRSAFPAQNLSLCPFLPIRQHGPIRPSALDTPFDPAGVAYCDSADACHEALARLDRAEDYEDHGEDVERGDEFCPVDPRVEVRRVPDEPRVEVRAVVFLSSVVPE